MPTRRIIHRTAHGVERRLERRRRTVSPEDAIISPYRGFGRGNEIIVRGRVLAEKRITRATDAEPLWRNVVNTYRRFRTDEVPDARVRATLHGAVTETLTDDEGHFEVHLEARELDRHRLWHEVSLELADGSASAIAHAIVPPDDAAFGMISDIDDTIVHTGATSLLRMARSVVAGAAQRLPFEGVADLYRALHMRRNPIFYVSSSPWNLYELLHDFMDLNGIPHGPMFLQDWGVDDETLILRAHERHKLEQITALIDFYPSLPFILIGDSGQHDPEIYLQVIQSHPKQILAAFIRDVTPDLRDAAVARIISASNAAGVEMLYVRDSAEALEHARRLGFVSAASA